MYTLIRATTITITELLREHFESDAALRPVFNAGAGGVMVVSPNTPQEMSDHSIIGLSVWLYRIARDDNLLNHPPRRVAFDRMESRPLPLRLHYLMTPIVSRDEMGPGPSLEQSIIGKVLQTLHDHPLLAGAFLRDDLAGTGAQLAVRLEPLGLEEITRVWDALEESYQLCISYEVSVIMLASDEEVHRIAPVDVVEPEYGVITAGEAVP
jgi:hypothetical protein